jgi:hypothetical protein
MNAIKRFFVDLFTEDDNYTWCIARVSTFLALLSFIGLGITHVVMNHQFQPSEYGVGIGSLLGGAGVLIGGKAATQKENVEKLDK